MLSFQKLKYRITNIGNCSRNIFRFYLLDKVFFRGGEQFVTNWFNGGIIKFEYLTRFTLEQSNR